MPLSGRSADCVARSGSGRKADMPNQRVNVRHDPKRTKLTPYGSHRGKRPWDTCDREMVLSSTTYRTARASPSMEPTMATKAADLVQKEGRGGQAHDILGSVQVNKAIRCKMVPTQDCSAGETFGGQQEFASRNGKRSSVLKSGSWLKHGVVGGRNRWAVLQQHLMNPRQQLN